MRLQSPATDPKIEFDAAHNDLIGHGGAFVTLQRVLRNGRAWSSQKQMLADIDSFLRGCPCCQKMRKCGAHSLDARHIISGSPFSELSIDVLKLPNPDAYGYQYIAVVVDNFSHWTSLVAMKNKSAFEAARALLQVVGNFGAPLRLRSDGGSEFVNGVISSLTALMGIQQHVVLPYTPTVNGIVERANRAILERLREMVFCKRIVKHPEHVWSDLLPLVQRSINSSYHSAIGTSPSAIMFGNNLELDRCLLSQMPDSKQFDVSTYVGALSFNQRIIIEEADKFQIEMCKKVIDRANKSQQRSKKGELFTPMPKALAVGDWVLAKPQESFPLHKLAPRWLGPFQIDACDDNDEVVCVYDSLRNKRRQFLKRNLEVFDMSAVSNIEGLKKVAERDNFEFPVESICGHALITEGGIGASPVQLPSTFQRGSRAKSSFQFLIKWAGYEEPTWVAYKTACRLVEFPAYVSFLPNLRMDLTSVILSSQFIH